MTRARALALALMVGALVGGCATTAPDDVLANGAISTAEEESRLVVVTVDNDVPGTPPRPASTRPGYVAADYSGGPLARATMRQLASEYGLTPVAAWPIEVLKMHCAVLRIPAGESREQLLQRLGQDRRVRVAQPMNAFSLQSIRFNDPYAEQQTGFRSIGAASAQQWSLGEGVR